ncbi:aKG-HExxH-type peptide beta-hydroxylase [Methylosinus trichosporium]|nr:HEXXH motif-containing putative peptide modification protein [Methylosinus trichosporium]
MREDLAASLERLGARAGAVLPLAPDAAAIARDIRSRRVAPGVFGRYYDLVTALQTEDWTAAARLWREIAQEAARPADFAVLPFDAEALGDDAGRYQRMFTIGLAAAPQFARPDDDALTHLRESLSAALALLDAVHADWAAEIRALIGQVIAVVRPAADAVSMSGGSSMMLWGAVLIDVGARPDRIRVLSVLAHEATHQLLFGLARSEPLVMNPVRERFCTPLRPTPRPMNAIFHSTYVSGRIHALFEILRPRARLSDAEAALVAEISDLQRRRFAQGSELILEQARSSALGRRLIEEARDVIAGGEQSRGGMTEAGRNKVCRTET